VRADLGAEYPALLGIAIGALVMGTLLLVVGGFLIAGAIRRSRATTV
jgi:Ca2+/H+ antiporter